MKSLRVSCLLFALLALVAAGCTTRPQAKAQADYDVAFTLTTLMDDEGMRFVGVGDEIDGLINPDLIVEPGDTVQVTLIKGDVTGNPHDFAVPDLDAKT